MRLIAPLALSLAILSAPAFADAVSGEVLTYDPVTTILTLTDNTEWSLRDGGATAPEGVKSGDRVTIIFVSNGDSGFGKIKDVAIQQ